MKNSSSSAALLLFCALLGATTAHAVQNAPHRLVAPKADPLDNDAAADEVFDEDTPAPTIQAAPVTQPSVSGFGTLEPSHGGLPPTIWNGSTRDSAAGLLPLLASGVTDASLRDLLIRLLMTQATPPSGSEADWFLLRVNALIALGADDKAEQMIASLPASMTSDALRQVRVQLLLARNDVDGACKLTASSATDAMLWRKTAILCKLRSGSHDEAMLALDMMREESQGDDPFFQDAVRRLADKNAAIKAFPKEWSLFDAALLRITGDLVSLKMHLDALPPAVVKYIAQDTSYDPKLREKAAERLAQLGVTPQNDYARTQEPLFERTLASDVATLVHSLASGKPANSGDDAIIARLQVGDAAGIQDNRRVQRLLTLMEPFGYTVPASQWQKLFIHHNRYDGEAPPAVLVERLRDAAAGGHRGEVILLAALIMDGQSSDHTSELALLPVVRALLACGFPQEARQIASDAVKTYGAR